MEKLNLKPTHKPVQNYYEALRQFRDLGVSHEGAVRSAFQTLLEHCGRQFGWKLVPEWPIKRDRAHSLRVDGALVDEFRLTHGFWEAKDSHDDLGKEVKKKLTAGYPQNNIIFQAPERAILWQNGRSVLDVDITEPVALVEIVKQFFDYTLPEYEDWSDAVTHFRDQVPELGRALAELIKDEEKSNPLFLAAFNDFLALCRQSINPNLSAQAVEEMLIQHLLTERIFRTVFNNPDFTRRNVIAAEIEKVIDTLTSQAFSRDAFLQRLDRFYVAIEKAARTIEDFTQKQEFLNTVYEKFFQGFSVKVADTHGIVYTPVSIVNFMVRSVEDILQKEFGKSLSSSDVHILDPFVGTGNFIVHIMEAIKTTALAEKYHDELHCNEVMLLPYYIASMNIEHEFLERTGKYASFEGICLVDTFELEEAKQISFFTTKNTERVERQKRAPIRVVIGNPPYNVGQVNENDNNKNRKYEAMDRLVADTYGKDSKATLVNKLRDPYVKAIRWASNRIGEEGIVALVTNNSFVDGRAYDGMRKHLEGDFDFIFVLDLGGNIRKKEVGTATYNIFGIRLGVSINFFVRNRRTSKERRSASIHYVKIPDGLTGNAQGVYLDDKRDLSQIEWKTVQPDENYTWLTEKLSTDFAYLMPLAEMNDDQPVEQVFGAYSLGISTNRDHFAYSFNRKLLLENLERFSNDYNAEVVRYRQMGRPKKVDEFVAYDKIKWSETLKAKLKAGRLFEIDPNNLRDTLYRPFTRRILYYDSLIIDRPARFLEILPTASRSENLIMCVTGPGSERPFMTLLTAYAPDLHVTSPGTGSQCFPFYTYNEDGTNRRENITDWALEQFRSHYKDKSITTSFIASTPCCITRSIASVTRRT